MLRISGPDAYTYLQGQFTQDLNAAPGFARYGLWLNQKGRVLADSVVLRCAQDEFLVISHSVNAQILRERLESYLIADEVTIEDQSMQHATVAVWGAGGSDLLKTLLAGQSLPSGSFGKTADGWLVFASRGRDKERFEVLVPREQSGAAARLLLQLGVAGATLTDFERARIEAGIPAVPADIGASDLPNEGGLDDVAISYTKGCYLGQEVMARLKNLGQVRRRLHVVRGSGSLPAPHAALYQGERKVGELRSLAPVADGFAAMAMISLLNFDAALGLGLAPNSTPALTIVRRV